MSGGTIDYEPIVLVTRGDELPKKNYEKKVHPTYETSIRMRNVKENTLTPVHVVVKFFDQYRSLCEQLEELQVGENKKIPLPAPFPPSYKKSFIGLGLSEDDLQQRCFLLNKWMQGVFSTYPKFPPEAQKLISEFLSLHDDNQQLEDNKEMILSLMSKTLTDIPVADSSSNNNVANKQPFPKISSSGDSSPSKLATSRVQSSRFSTVSEVPVLSGAELEEYSRETIIGDCFAISVLRGDMIPKRPNETRLHYSYESIMRMLPIEELSVSFFDDIDSVLYEQHVQQFTTIQTMKVFDSYRALKDKLEEEFGIFSNENTSKIVEYNEADEHILKPAIVVSAEFPKTYRRSALGIGLSEAQAQVRVVYLNHWLGELLKLFPKFPTKAQLEICSFFSLCTDESNGDLQQTEFVLSVLRGTYEIPRLSANKAESNGVKEKHRSYLHSILPTFNGSGGDINKKADMPPLPPIPAASVTNNSVIPHIPQDTDSVEEGENRDVIKDMPSNLYGGNSRMSEMTTNSSVLPMNQVLEYSKETVIHTYLGVLLIKGEMLAKKQNDSKLHIGYQAAIRILFTAEIPSSTLDPKIDHIEQYNSQYAALPTHKIAKVFDGYRSLHQKLEEYNIFSFDRAHHGKMNGCVVIEAKFPRTHKRSAFGISLTEKEIIQRTAELNHWLGALLAKFPQFTPTVQELIQEFLQLDDDNPAEPQNKVILQILKREFQFPQLPQNVPETPVNGQGTNNKVRRKTKYLGIIEERSPQSTSESGIGMTGEEGTEDITAGNGVQCGCQCIVM